MGKIDLLISFINIFITPKLNDMKQKLFLLLMIIVQMIVSCTKEHPVDKGPFPIQTTAVKIAVVSDIHYMDPSLLKNNASAGAAFQSYLDADPKLIEFSDPIFRTVISQLKSENPDILLIPGDLTKDGEKVSHQTMAILLKQLTDAHIRVFVVPGNHDVNNPEAATYDGDKGSPTPSVSASEFSSIYSAYGYGNAIARDPNSLSYVNQLVPGVWLLGLDDCEYEDNKDIAIVAGRIKPETMKWALGWMQEARRKHITVFGMMHHNIIEHYAGQSQLDPGYVTDNWESVSDQFINAGMSVMFTGHYHANDITMRTTGGKEFFDIETGSLVTAPIPYRMIEWKGNEMNIKTKYVTHINAKLPGDLDFPAYANTFPFAASGRLF